MTLSVPFSCCLFETDLLNVTVLMNFGSENVGMIMSIGQSVWSVLKENIKITGNYSQIFNPLVPQ